MPLKKKFTLEQIDQHILFLTEMEFGIKLFKKTNGDEDYDRYKYRKSFDRSSNVHKHYIMEQFKNKFGFFDKTYVIQLYYLTFYRAKINYFFDQTSINETKTNISDQNYAVIFGE